jgi:dTDP-4-amino-4,6-dideoxygalactose transaminase
MGKLALSGGSPVRSKPWPAWPFFDIGEETALLDVLRSGQWWHLSLEEGAETRTDAGGQPVSKVTEFEDAFAASQQALYGIACANGTAALEIALKSLGIGPGDEVLVPAYTFVATASAVLSINAVPIFVDIEEDTFNISIAGIRQAITSRTKAMIPVHFAGQAADMEAILKIASDKKLWIVEDAAHAHGAAWRGRGLGSLGDASTFSFQASKNMTAGEGGVILSNNRQLAARCRSYVWGGRDAGRPWYEHHRLGWNYRLTEFQAAILLCQLKRVEAQNRTRMKNAQYLSSRLSSIPGIHPLNISPDSTAHSHHIYIFRIYEEEFGMKRQQFLAALKAEGILCSEGYVHPLYRNPMFLKQDFYPRKCPVSCQHYGIPIDYSAFGTLCPNAEKACREAVWLEHRQLLGGQEDMDDIVAAVEKIHENRHELWGAQ